MQEVRKVLVYAYTGLGNFVLYAPALRAIKNFLPQASFTLLHGNDTGCHEVVSGSNLFNKYIIVKRDISWWIRIRWICRIRKEKFDMVISEFHNNNLFMVFLTIFSGTRYRLGHVSSPGWKNRWDFIYNIPVKMKENQHEIDRYLELAYALGISKQEIDKDPFIQINPEDREFSENFLISHTINNKQKIVGVQVGASSTQRWKQWSLNKYAKLCDKILELPNVKLILLGSSNELDMIENLVSKMKHKPVLAVGKTTIKQAAAIIERCKLFISNDSGLMHVSAAVGTPVITIYGPTDFQRTSPYGKEHVIIRKEIPCSPCFKMQEIDKAASCPHRECLNSISVEDVLKEVKHKLNEIS